MLTGAPGQTAFSITASADQQLVCQFTNTANPAIAITKTTTAPYVVPNGSIAYNVKVSNTSGTDAQHIRVTDSLPQGLTALHPLRSVIRLPAR